jgi:GT2 family glycosyltransferase
MALVSIVIPVFNMVEYTKMAIESIRRFTSEPHEIIVVDNASTDETPQYLSEQSDLTVIRNAENLGHAGGTNVGARASRGEYFVWLNNDAVVTVNWLTNLLRCADSDERIGLVSPVTNYIGNPQQRVPVKFADLEEMHGFAASFNRSDPAKWKDDGPFGFCVLVKRKVVDEVGYLSEDNDLGLGDDQDYNRRLVQAGYRCVLACDAFVYHFGSRTFRLVSAERRAAQEGWSA